MKKLAIVLPIVIAAGALLLTACESPIWSRSDTEVAFDSSGHVTKDVTYTYDGKDTETYSAGGTYEDVQKAWDATSSTWKQSAGDKGTYSYDTRIRMLTINYTQKWNGGINGSYVTLTSGSTDTKTDSWNQVLGSTNEYPAYLGSGGAYVQTENVTYWDGTSETGTWTITVPADLSIYAYTTEYVVYDATGTATSGSSKTNYVYTVSAIFPGSVISLDNAKGQTVTLDYLKYVSTPYTWSSGSTFTAGTPTTYNSSGSNTVSVASDGPYLTFPSITVARHMTSK